MTEFEAALQALNDSMGDDFPAEVLAILDEGHAMIANSGVEESALKEGDQFPGFKLPDATGQLVDSAELLAKGPLVINFYRGSWCPYCVIELKAYRDRLDEIHALGAELVSASPEKPDGSMSLKEKENLPFPVLTDSGLQLAEKMGIVFDFPAIFQELYSQNDMSLPDVNDGSEWRMPMASTFVIAQDGRIVLAHAKTDHTTRLDPDKVIEALKAL